MKKTGLTDKLRKIPVALVEGKLIRKSWGAIAHAWRELIASIDRRIGIIAKYFLAISTPVQNNKIVFITFQGDYTCNPKYITEQLLSMDCDLDIVWGSRKKNLEEPGTFPAGVRVVEQHTVAFYKELASAKVWVANSVDFLKNPIYKKKDQIMIETWHGSLGIKRFDKDSNSGRRWVGAAELTGKIANYCISNSTFETNVYRETYWPDTPVLEYGHPRNDILMPGHEEKRAALKRQVFSLYGIEEGTKVLLYAPTFRDSKSFVFYNIDYRRLVPALEERFGGKWKVLVRFHPTVRKFAEKRARLTDDVVDVTTYPDIQDIMVISDAAITDYSSWIYDFVLLRKPGFIFATDVDAYNNERGFYYKLETTPFAVATNNDQLIEKVLNFDESKYQSDVERFLQDKGCIEDGHASERVAEKILEIINTQEQ